MKPVNPIDWHSWRQGGIGSSDAPAVMNSSPWATPKSIWEIKTGRAIAPPPNFPMRRGIKLEPVARDAYEQKTGIAMPKKLFEHSKLDFLRASLDGVNLEVRRALEIKCPGREDHKTALKGRIPQKYLWQCVHILMVTGLEHLDYFSFDGKEGVIVPFERNEKFEKALLREEIHFWECVLKDIPPDSRRQNVEQTKKAPSLSLTAREIQEILEKAHALGVRSLKIDNLEVDFNNFKKAEEPAREEAPETHAESCERCGSELTLGKFGPYCKPCFIEKKENASRNNVRSPFRVRQS